MALSPPSWRTRANGLVVEQRDAVPQDVAAGRPNQDGALADGDLGLAGYGDEALLVAGEWREDVLVLGGAQGVEGGEFLAGAGGELARVIANDARGEGLGVVRGELCAAGGAD